MDRKRAWHATFSWESEINLGLFNSDKAKDAIQMIEPEMEGFEMKYVDIDNPIPIYPEYVLK